MTLLTCFYCFNSLLLFFWSDLLCMRASLSLLLVAFLSSGHFLFSFGIYLLGRTMIFFPSVFPPSFFLFLFLFLWIYTLLIDERFLFRYRCTWQEKKNQDEKTHRHGSRRRKGINRNCSAFVRVFNFYSLSSLSFLSVLLVKGACRDRV